MNKSMGFDIDLTAVDDYDDISLEDATTYKDATGAAPQVPGNYRVKVVEGGIRLNQAGEKILDNGYEQIEVKKVVVVEPEEFAGKELFPFKSYSLKRFGTGTRPNSSNAEDLLRGFDDQATYVNGKDLITQVLQHVSNGEALNVSSNWVAKDSDYIRETIDNAGGDLSNLEEAERKDLFKKAIIRGQKKFDKDGQGGFLPTVTGPSGNVLEARVDLTRVWPSSKLVKKMGPFGPAKK